mgnify:CR=1 FL=1
MAIKVGNTYVSEAAYIQAKARIANEQNSGKGASDSDLKTLRQKMSGWDVSTITQPFKGSGSKSIGIHPSILREMERDPEKKLEYEALLIDIKNTSVSENLPKGMKLISEGYIIGADGGVSSWCITRTEGNKLSQASTMLPKDKKKDWNDILLENLLKNKREADENSSGIYYKV